MDGFDGQNEIANYIKFRNKPARPNVLRLLRTVLVGIHSDHQNFGVREGIQYLPCGLESIHVRHADIQQNHVRPQLRSLAHSISSIHRFRQYFPSILVGQKTADSFAYGFVVVRNKYF